MAIPAINTALIPGDQKDAFNAGSPATDAAQFQATGEATGDGLRAAVDAVLGPQDGGPLGDLTSAQVAGALIPDIVTIDFSAPVVFPNGRQLTNDVVDTAVGIVLNRGGAAGVSDGIDGNDKTFSSAFPARVRTSSARYSATSTGWSAGCAELANSSYARPGARRRLWTRPPSA